MERIKIQYDDEIWSIKRGADLKKQLSYARDEFDIPHEIEIRLYDGNVRIGATAFPDVEEDAVLLLRRMDEANTPRLRAPPPAKAKKAARGDPQLDEDGKYVYNLTMLDGAELTFRIKPQRSFAVLFEHLVKEQGLLRSSFEILIASSGTRLRDEWTVKELFGHDVAEPDGEVKLQCLLRYDGGGI